MMNRSAAKSEPLWSFRTDWTPYVLDGVAVSDNPSGVIRGKDGNQSIRLNPVSVLVFELCREHIPFGEMVELLTGHFGAPEERVREDVNNTLTKFRRLGFIRVHPVDDITESFPIDTGDAELLHREPYVMTLDNLIDAQTRAGLIALVADDLEAAGVYINGASEVMEARQAMSRKVSIDNQDPAVRNLLEAYGRRTGLDSTRLEKIELIRYQPGGFYKPHADALDFLDPRGSWAVDPEYGQRIFSTVIYLNDDFEGGETWFPKLNIDITPRAGSAVMFSNCKPGDIAVDPMASHGGRPVTSGTKWVATLWHRNMSWRPTPG